MSVNDFLKVDLYFKNEMNSHLRVIIFNGNDIERQYALVILWQLCFQITISKSLIKDTEFYRFIKKLSNEKHYEKNISKYAGGLTWLLDNQSSEASKAPDLKSHQLFISYNRNNSKFCLKLKSELEKLNLKVCIDLEERNSSSLERFQKSVVNSDYVVIICNQKYKLSTFARAEAEYAYQLKIPIIPVVTQNGYKPDGW